MGDNTGKKAHAIYDYFALENEQAKYKLLLGAYNGTAGDGMKGCSFSFQNQHGMPFSTPDKDSDTYSGNCAQLNSAGWWFNQCYCSILNTPYNNGYMYGWNAFSSTLKCSEMKLRYGD